MVVLAWRRLYPNPAAYLAPRLPPFFLGQSRLHPIRLGHAMASPTSLLPGQSRLRPGLPATIAIANNTFLVAIESFSSVIAREADEAYGRWARAPAMRREPQRREAGEVAALICLAWCALSQINCILVLSS